MADRPLQGSPPVTPTNKNFPDRTKSCKTATQGVQLLPILTKYFKYAGLLLLVWIFGYFGLSSAWVMVGLFFYVINSEYRKVKERKQSFAVDAHLTSERSAILARVDELPSWVYFPDIERAEWLNKMLRQLWPYIGDYVKKLLKETVEPIVQNTLPNSLRPFKFEHIDLGDMPLRVGGVKVYTERVARDEIVMDMEVFYAGDAEIKVAVRGMNAGIRRLTIHGIVRVVMRPLVPVIPLIGGLNVFFLSQPTVDFDLTNVANILDMPLLSNTLRTVIVDQISYFMVLPNKIPIQLVKNIDIQALKYPVPQGVVRLHLVAARELLKADIGLMGKGKSDPYCKIYVGASTFKTKVVENTVNPVWNQYFEGVVDQRHGQVVDIECLDQDPGEDDELGTTSLDIEAVANHGSMDSWLPLDNVSTGMVHVRALWLHLSKDPDDLEREKDARDKRNALNLKAGFTKSYEDSVRTGSEDHLSSALLMVTLDSAKNLPRTKKTMSEPSPYVKLGVGNDVKKTPPKAKTTDPTWEENFQFLIHDPRVQELYLEVIDSKKNTKRDKEGKVLDESKKDKLLGKLSFPIKNLLTARDLTINRPFQLSGGDAQTQSQITLRLCLRILTSEMPAEWALDECAHDPVPTPTASSMETPSPAANPQTRTSAQRSPFKTSPTGAVTSPAATLGSADVNQNANFVVGGDSDAISNGSSAGAPERPIQELRYRGQTSSIPGSPAPYGRIQVTTRYSVQRSRLIAVIHKCVGLLALDDDNLSDPYVRIYLLPDRSSSTKKKTLTVKNNLDPIFDETFEWAVSQTEAATKTMDIMVKNSVGVFSRGKTAMGQIYVDLAQFPDLTKATTEWYDLQDPEYQKRTV